MPSRYDSTVWIDTTKPEAGIVTLPAGQPPGSANPTRVAMLDRYFPSLSVGSFAGSGWRSLLSAERQPRRASSPWWQVQEHCPRMSAS